MLVLNVRNVCEAWPQAVKLIHEIGEPEPSRAGPVLVAPTPVTTIYDEPRERVLFCPVRDANPMFHFMESLWMLAGRRDATWLDQFVKDFSVRFGERGGLQWGAYGDRWRKWFLYDQINEIVSLLKRDPTSRQAVLGMWDPNKDLTNFVVKDKPCNLLCCFRIVDDPDGGKCLNMMVTCRSNDIVWGCYGANAVHMSILLEYLAARIGVKVGVYTQVSWNWHAYLDTLPKEVPERCDLYFQERIKPEPLVDNPEMFDGDLKLFFGENFDKVSYHNTIFPTTAVTMLQAAREWRAGNRSVALSIAEKIRAPDWRIAVVEWMTRRLRSGTRADTL